MLKFSLPLIVLVVAAPSVCADAVRLQIIGPDKKPIAGAQVRIVEASGSWQERKIEAPLDLSSDAAGKITFESKNSLAAEPKAVPFAPPTSIMARVMAPNMAVKFTAFKAGDNEIELQTGQNFGGVVLDEDQKPVAGVTLVLYDSVGFLESAKELRIETKTDTAGKWSFSGVPREGSALIGIDDPRFVRETLTLSLASPQAPPLFLERGATLKGRLLTPDGQAAAGVMLYPGGAGGLSLDRDDFRTAPDGRFSLSGLRAGDYYLQNINFGNRKPLAFIVEPKRIQSLKTGEIRDLGDWKTESGVMVKGNIVESGTKKPIEGAYISLYGNGNGQGTSDKNGVISFRSAKDATQGSFGAPGFVTIQKRVADAVNGVLDLGIIELKRGIEVRGTLKDKNGRAVGGMQIYADKPRGERSYGRTDDDGTFAFDALDVGSYTLKVEGAKLVSGANFSVTAGQPLPPIAAVIDSEIQADVPQLLVGRALDGVGKAVAGAKISLRIKSGSSYRDVTTTSGIDGNFEVKFNLSNATPTISEAKRPGLLFVRSDDFKIVDGAWRADVLFQPRGTMLRGRVVNEAGQPLARAWVSIAGRNDVPVVQSDDLGLFSIPDVPLEGVTLLASNGRIYSASKIEKAGGKVEISLPKATNYEAEALANEILPTSQLGNLYGARWDEIWDTLGMQRLEAALLRANQGGFGWEWTWSQYLRQLARRDAASFLARGDELVALAGKNNIDAASVLARLRARSTDPEQREKARLWLETQSKAPRTLTAGAVAPLLQMAVVAEALKEGDGAKWVEFAAQVAAQLTDKARASSATEWGTIAVRVGPNALEDLLQEWGDNAKLNALGGALTALVQASDLAGATEMLSRMEVLLPAAQVAKDEVVVETFVQKPKDIVEQARGELVALLAKTDPKAAMELAKKGVAEYRLTELLLIIGKNAARLGQIDLAATALREVFEAKYSNVEPGAKAAEIALGFDAKLADELFQMAWEKSKPRGPIDDFGYRPSIAAYATARHKSWAGQSRILIEREWAERIKNYKAPADNDYDSNSESLKALVGAMAHLDARRALEMVEQLPEKGTARAESRGRIALTLLSP